MHIKMSFLFNIRLFCAKLWDIFHYPQERVCFMYKKLMFCVLPLVVTMFCCSAERPLKRQRLAGPVEDAQYSPELQIVPVEDVDRSPELQDVMYLFTSPQSLETRQSALKKLTNEDYVKFLHRRHPGKVFVGDRLSRKEILQTIFPAAIANLVDNYGWRNPNITAGYYRENIPHVHYCTYSCSSPPREIVVMSESCREDIDWRPSLIHIVTHQQLQDSISLHQYINKKPSQKTLDDLAAGNQYLERTLLLLKEGTLFDAPVLEPIETKEDS
jgi:hypothetical protein